ncbi:hypothetical protein [Fervidobacterium sp.]
MKRYTILVVLFIAIDIIFAGELYDFAYNFLLKQKVPENHAAIMANVLEEEKEIIPKSVDPLYMLAFGLAETGFSNVFGDYGKAVGYFQIHESAVFYVANFYEDVREFKKKVRNHSDLINYPDWQLRIAYRYIYLSLRYMFNWDLARAISAYNGRRDKYNEYTIKFFGYYTHIIKEYMIFQNSNQKTKQ